VSDKLHDKHIIYIVESYEFLTGKLILTKVIFDI